MILFVEIFANIKCYAFKLYIRACKLQNEMREVRKFLKFHFLW